MNLRSLFFVVFIAVFAMFAPGCTSKDKSGKDVWAEREEINRQMAQKRWLAFEAREKATAEEWEKKGAALDTTKELLAWVAFYRYELGRMVDFSRLKIPERPHGAYALVVVAKGVTADSLLNMCSLRFDTWCYPERFNSLRSTRDVSETYAVWLQWVRVGNPTFVYADRYAAMAGQEPATLTEYLLYELKFFMENRYHPFPFMVCPGSRSLRDDMPCVRWLNDAQEFRVFMYGAMK